MKEVILLEAFSRQDFNEEIQDYLNKGYTPFPNITVTHVPALYIGEAIFHASYTQYNILVYKP